ncbi:g-patch domain and KOW motifs-containing protein [Acrasis kona]|uniref:G-patch domain and KOW motifs-containing protein n=1 Tax=Acrasis kona TaxID=1008807 RepID=A0AAW2YRA9_9EUKA
MSESKISFSVSSAKNKLQKKPENIIANNEGTIRFENNRIVNAEENTKQPVVIPCKGNTFMSTKSEELNKNPTSKRPREDDNLSFQFDKMQKTESQIAIKDFGVAMLMGMGWKKGQAYGRSDKVVEPIQASQRPKLAGIGANITDVMDGESYNKSMESDVTLEEFWMNKSSKRIERDVIVNVVDGLYDGLFGRMSGKSSLFEVRISCDYLEPFPNALRELNEHHDVRSFAHNQFCFKQKDVVKEEIKNKKQDYEHVDNTPPSDIKWVVPRLRVRIISKHYARGRYYNTKAIVHDVPERHYCTLQDEQTGKLLENVEERMLETYIPRELNTKIQCVSGKYRGKRGIMIDKDKKREMCTLQVVDERDDDYGEAFTEHFDSVCEYV